MSNLEQIQLFGGKQIRTAWNDAEEKWYFSVIDIISGHEELNSAANVPESEIEGFGGSYCRKVILGKSAGGSCL